MAESHRMDRGVNWSKERSKRISDLRERPNILASCRSRRVRAMRTKRCGESLLKWKLSASFGGAMNARTVEDSMVDPLTRNWPEPLVGMKTKM